MKTEPRWLSTRLVMAIHAESLRRFGGAPGLRDENLLESALARPINLWTYKDEATVFELAACLGYGLIRNHAFIDGNKRIGVLAVNAFLHLNGQRFDPDQADEVLTILGVAAGEIDEVAFARWLGDNCRPTS